MTKRASPCAIDAVEAHLADAFLDRVRRAYRRAICSAGTISGQWFDIDARRADVHAAALADRNDALRAIFADPTTTDLFYGVDDLCRSIIRLRAPADFVGIALQHDRARIAAYQIARVQELMPDTRSVIEIGPGMGRAAYFGHLAGLDYTTVDLPLGIVAQACFLGQAVGPDALWFAGEAIALSLGRIKLLYSLPDRHFDIMLNVDSITEMPAAVAFNYFRWAESHARRLLSINHDKNRFTVSQLAAFSISAQTIAKRPCPAWPGYVEEAFLLGQQDILPGKLRLGAFEAFILIHRIRRRLLRGLFRQSASCS